MKTVSILLITFSLLGIVSCTENKTSTGNTDENQNEQIQASVDTPALETGENAAASAETPAASGQQVTPASTSAGPTAEALNPAHGEPGHDCSIPVGAPLSSAKAGGTNTIQMGNQNPSSVQGSQTITPAQPPAPVMAIPGNQTPPNMTGKANPAHGEPGHDCSKPVGAIL